MICEEQELPRVDIDQIYQIFTVVDMLSSIFIWRNFVESTKHWPRAILLFYGNICEFAPDESPAFLLLVDNVGMKETSFSRVNLQHLNLSPPLVPVRVRPNPMHS